MPRLPSHRPPAPDATPRCKHFGTCGGCSLLDQPIAWQLADKVAACERLLAPSLGDVRIDSTTPDRSPRHYRTRLLYPVRADRGGLPIVGIYEFRSHHVVRVEECQTQDVWLTDFGRAMEDVLRKLQLQPFVPGNGRGMVKAIWARLASGTGEICAGIVTRPGAFPQAQEFADAAMKTAEAVPKGRQGRHLVGIVHSISERDDEFLLGDRHMPLRGRDHVIDRRDGLVFKISAGSYYQVHAGAGGLLYGPTMALCGDVRGKTVVDGYGGVGAFGLRLAKAGAASVTIVEDNAAACRDAEHNIKANELTNVTVVAQPFGSVRLPERPDLLLVDPPRSGLGDKGIARALAARPERIVYVACAADSLARDVAQLAANGYRLQAVRLCDLFPHTEHVELVAMLTRT